MTKNKTNPRVDAYLDEAPRWQQEMKRLRKIVLHSPLTEDFKWGKPCYTFAGANVVLIIGFKNYCSLLFCKGALLKDPDGLLVKAGENTQAARQIRFASLGEISGKEAGLKAYVQEALEVEKAGLKVSFKKISEFSVPDELQRKLNEMPALKKAFAALTPGRQRGYIIYFSAAKQAQTRASRVEKCIPQILEGKGLNDR